MSGMAGWEDQGRFWMQFFRYTLPNPSFGKSEVTVTQRPDKLSVVLTLQDAKDNAALDAVPDFLFRTGGELTAYQMEKIAPNKYEAQIQLPEPGAYQGVVRYTIHGEEEESLAPIQVDYPTEWHFSDPIFESETYQIMQTNLANSDLTIEAELANSISSSTEREFDWYYLVLFLVLLSWPIEIGIRRWQMPWRRP
jgi:hypothetical protein